MLLTSGYFNPFLALHFSRVRTPLATRLMDSGYQSNLALHWVNDLPGALGQIKQVCFHLGFLVSRSHLHVHAENRTGHACVTMRIFWAVQAHSSSSLNCEHLPPYLDIFSFSFLDETSTEWWPHLWSCHIPPGRPARARCTGNRFCGTPPMMRGQ